MSNESLGLSLKELRDEMCRFIGEPRQYSAASKNARREADSYIKRGLRQFLNPPILPGESHSHTWSFLYPYGTLLTGAPYSTGTITSTASTVTSAGGAEWSGGVGLEAFEVGSSIVAGSQRRWITAIANGSPDTMTTDVAFEPVFSGATKYTVLQNSYILPDDFGHLEGDIFFAQENGIVPIKYVNEQEFNLLESEDPDKTGRPRYCTVVPDQYGTSEYSPERPMRHRLLMWPSPDAVYMLRYKYYALQPYPTDTTVSFTAPVLMGSQQHAETITTSCLAVAEEYGETSSSRYREIFIQKLAASVSFDRRAGSRSRSYGYNADRSDQVIRHGIRRGDDFDVLVDTGSGYVLP